MESRYFHHWNSEKKSMIMIRWGGPSSFLSSDIIYSRNWVTLRWGVCHALHFILLSSSLLDNDKQLFPVHSSEKERRCPLHFTKQVHDHRRGAKRFVCSSQRDTWQMTPCEDPPRRQQLVRCAVATWPSATQTSGLITGYVLDDICFGV